MQIVNNFFLCFAQILSLKQRLFSICFNPGKKIEQYSYWKESLVGVDAKRMLKYEAHKSKGWRSLFFPLSALNLVDDKGSVFAALYACFYKVFQLKVGIYFFIAFK